MTLETIENESSAKRKLILRDALTFLTLILVTVLLFAVTLFLFRSFTAHREELAKRWSARGREAIASGRPDQAIVALRTALSYAPGEPSYELLLAQALGAEAGAPGRRRAGNPVPGYQLAGLREVFRGVGLISQRPAQVGDERVRAQAGERGEIPAVEVQEAFAVHRWLQVRNRAAG